MGRTEYSVLPMIRIFAGKKRETCYAPEDGLRHRI